MEIFTYVLLVLGKILNIFKTKSPILTKAAFIWLNKYSKPVMLWNII